MKVENRYFEYIPEFQANVPIYAFYSASRVQSKEEKKRHV